ncbi:hypothetical protein ABTN42_22015, partial [Acinetobacter baumannii]
PCVIDGADNTFHGFATNFLDYAMLAQGGRAEPQKLSPERTGGAEMDLRIPTQSSLGVRTMRFMGMIRDFARKAQRGSLPVLRSQRD